MRLPTQGKLILAIVFLAIVLSPTWSHAAPKADLWARWQKHDAANSQKIDHGAWNGFLKKYLIAPHPSGVNRLRYAAVSPEDRKALRNYLDQLQGVAISSYNRAEQKAYWINLYNALTVHVVLVHYPVDSIRDIGISPGLFSRGPWGAKLAAVEAEKLSLDDVEHRILRPIWKDPRLHYAVNCASLGCPNLQPEAYAGDNSDALLEKGAREYVNHPRGVAFKNGKLAVSSIYEWFKEDFGSSREALMQHWLKYADKPLAAALKGHSGGFSHAYDWSLNGPEQKLQ
jgi:hypothetical protein